MSDDGGDQHEADHPAPGAGASRARSGPSLMVIGAALVIVVGLGVAGWALVRSDPDPAPTLSAPDTRLDVVPVPMVAGCWTVAPGPQTYVGYRIDEEIVGVPTPSEVTGRTPAVEGGIIIRGDEIIGGVLAADLRQLASDDPERDDALRTRGLETDVHPQAIFLLAGGTTVPTPIEAGTPVQVALCGDLDLHGETRPLTLEVQAQVLGQGDDTQIEAIATAPLRLADHGIEPPDVASVLSVADEGQLEVSVRLVRDDATCQAIADQTAPSGGASPPGTGGP